MSNTLNFGSFHARHFGSQSTQAWQHILGSSQPQQQENHTGYYYDRSSDPYTTTYAYDQDYYYENQPNYAYYDTQGADQKEAYHEEYIEEEEEQPSTSQLTQEQIEIFRFSEAYRKKRLAEEEQSVTSEPDDDELISKPFHDWAEAPAARLVLNEASNPSDEVRIREHMLNAAYIDECLNQEHEVVLWPVLPLAL
ncbi:hypothetical protein BCR43DRAFT_327598 [Syncephalastrum racemosum]|uniref:Uncharacterized protein n=1 Tax=Syncephalastrum racemosum TaxID=13706 RepID=A0A1X2H7W7_SYNRA|nr:hypothetical protein BCR43DRAFT_327598 [Syncephalastrum racemosum]